MVSNCVVDHFTLEELCEVENEGEDDEGTDEVDDVISLSGGVLLSSVVVQRVVDSHVALQGHDKRHVDAAHQRDGVERVYEVREHQSLEIGVEAEISEGVHHHGDQVDQVEYGQDGEELVERVSHADTEEEEDGDGVSNHTETAEDHLHHSVQDKAQTAQTHQLLV